ncbi:MAG: FG-GAP-like repeat-containing protein [Cyclobacteriaceae bacterium]
MILTIGMKLIRIKTLALFILAFNFCAFGQAPIVSSVNQSSGRAGDAVTISGINFGTNANNIKVGFGSVFATPKTITDQFIEVKIPNGTVYENISVTNTSTGLSGYSGSPFLLSFGGNAAFDATKMSSQFDFATDSVTDLYDLTLADFDGDGKSDVATSHKNSTNVYVQQNTSSPGGLSFNRIVLSAGVNTFHVTSGDLNGDSKPEIIVSELNGAHVLIFKNNSTLGNISFSGPQSITINGGSVVPKTSKIRVMDMDLDGKAELLVTDQAASRVFVLPNQSSLASISFGSPNITTFLTSGNSYTDGVDVGDFDGDMLPEIVVSEFLGSHIFILKNQSVLGSLSFGDFIQITVSTQISSVRVGDLDGDSKPDLAASALLASSVLIFGNQSSGSTIKFTANPVLVTTNAQPWGLDFGDMDGDGKADIAVASITQKSVNVLNNQSTAGNFSFTTKSINTKFITRHIRIGDLDNDGKPDLGFTSIDDLNSGKRPSKFSGFINLNCVVPTLSPVGPLTICTGFTQRLTTSNNPGSTYQWFKNSVSLGAPSTTSYLDVTSTGSYTVSQISGTCSALSSAVNITVLSATSLSTATPTPVPPVCLGGTLSLSVNDVSATDYVWSGPGAYTAHGRSVTRTNFQADQTGKYTVDIYSGSCVIQRDTVIVDVVSVPELSIYYSGANIICQGQNKLISIYPSMTGYNYQWNEQAAGDISGATSSTYSATASGGYSVKLTSIANPTCPAIQSAVKTLKVATIPTVDFSSLTTTCVNSPVTFTNQSTLDSDTTGLHVQFAWDFGDGNIASTPNSSHSFASVQTFSVKLSVSYIGQSCPASKTKMLTVQSPPSVSIINPSNIYSFCPKDSLLLQVSGTFDTYSWSNGSSTASTYVKDGGQISVTITSGNCQVLASKTIVEFPSPNVIVKSGRKTVKLGDTTQLSATGIATNLVWTHGKTLSDSTSATPIATPILTAYYTASGSDVNGCLGADSVQIVVYQDKPLNTLKPSPFFSPNSDGINDVWIVDNAPALNQCGVVVYDERGFKVFSAKPYMNDWNGSSNGKDLPDGVYYYIFKCDDSSKNYAAGSINLIR